MGKETVLLYISWVIIATGIISITVFVVGPKVPPDAFGGCHTFSDAPADYEVQSEVSNQDSDIQNQTYNKTVTIERMNCADFVIVSVREDAYRNYPIYTENMSERGFYNRSLNSTKSIVKYSNKNPHEVDRVPNTAGEVIPMQSSNEGVVLFNPGDKVVVTNLESFDSVLIFEGVSRYRDDFQSSGWSHMTSEPQEEAADPRF